MPARQPGAQAACASAGLLSPLPCSGLGQADPDAGPGGQPCAQSAGAELRGLFTRDQPRDASACPACLLINPALEAPGDAAVLALFEFLHKSETFKNTNSILLECHSRI